MPLSIRPTGATLGAFVDGVDLDALTDDEWRTVHGAFLEHALLIFPGQHLDARGQERFARRFGEIEILVENLRSIPISNRDGTGARLPEDSHFGRLLQGNEGWHTDSSYMPLAAKASVLSAQVVPSRGGETEWADARDAWETLDATLQARLEDLVAYHSYFHSQAQMGHDVEVGAGYGFFEGEPPLRPLVKTHPETGRRAVFIGRHAYGVSGLSEAESATLLDDLTTHCCQAPRTFLHAWRPGDVAVWDNRCVLHRARPYDWDEDRVMLHTRIKGDPATESALNA